MLLLLLLLLLQQALGTGGGRCLQLPLYDGGVLGLGLFTTPAALPGGLLSGTVGLACSAEML